MKSEVSRQWGRRRASRADTAERLISIIGGGALAALGIKRLVGERSTTNVAITAGAGLLVYNGLRTYDGAARRGAHMEATFTINRPVEECYRYWRNVENLPKFMRHIDSVQVSGNRLHWVARGPLGAQLSWDTDMTDQKENEWIAWRSVEGAPLHHAGSVHFRAAAGNRGTVVTVAIQYQPIGKGISETLLELLGKAPEFQLREELRHFKQLMEAGEIPTTEGQPTGRRSAVVSLLQKATREPRLPQVVGARSA